MLWKNTITKAVFGCSQFWVGPVTFSPSSDRPKRACHSDLTSRARHGVHKGASLLLGFLRRAWILAERASRGKGKFSEPSETSHRRFTGFPQQLISHKL